jgi:hypothetical protein
MKCIKWPPPGSTEAQAQGCTCPVADNKFGKGQPSENGDSANYWVRTDCPVHDKLVDD